MKMQISIHYKDQQKPKQYQIQSNQVIIGRNPPQGGIIIQSSTVSRSHAIIKLSDNKLFIQDLKSSNGTFINGQSIPIGKQILLNSTDIIKIAQFQGWLTITKKNNKKDKQQQQDLEDSNSQQQQRSRQKKIKNKSKQKIKISESTMKMIKQMIDQKKSKDQRIKFLKLLGYKNADQKLQQIQQLAIKSIKSNKQHLKKTQYQLQKQFTQSRSTMEKKGLGSSI